jgi:hypothetical protein
MEKLVFCGGLPRTGSTVLMNILQQNPRIFTTGTCALTNIINDNIIRDTKSELTFKAMKSEQADSALYGFVQGATKGWFESLTDKPVIISKNRSWGELLHLYPNAKFLCLVRDLRDIVDSFEKMNSNINSLHSTSLNSNRFVPAMCDRDKYEYYFNSLNSLSHGLSFIKNYIEIYKYDKEFRETNTRILFVRYEMLRGNPENILNKIYYHLNEEEYAHDLDNISQSYLYEHDNVYQQEYTNHTTESQIIRGYDYDRKRPLCDDFYSLIVQEYKWYYERFYPGVVSNAR